MSPTVDDQLQRLFDISEIRDVLLRYCRGIDRRDNDLVRSCYHPDAIDDHGDYRGDVDGFLAYVNRGMTAFDRTMHFVGNMLIEPEGDFARAETYIVAHHHLLESSKKPERDYVVGLRYVDEFERRNDDWRIATRLCVFEWSRIDPVAPGGWAPSLEASLGQANDNDPVFAPSLRALLTSKEQ